jgi:hypothetical protein
MVFVDSLIKNSSLKIGFLSIFTVFIQLFGYGIGFITEFFFRNILRKGPTKRFKIY